MLTSSFTAFKSHSAYKFVSKQNTQANIPNHSRAKEDRLQRRPDDDFGKPGSHLHQSDGIKGIKNVLYHYSCQIKQDPTNISQT